jgi:hypothetical protein
LQLPHSEFKLGRVDPLSYADHASLRPDDVCYCLGEYTAHRGDAFSRTNRLIGHLKIRPSLASPEELENKAQAIRIAAEAFRSALDRDFHYASIASATLVPIPPSANRDDVLYDDRVLRILLLLGEGLGLDIRELVKQHKSVQPAHEADTRPTVCELVENYYIDESLTQPVPNVVWIFDDVLTGGNHYKAMQSVIQQRFPSVATIGVFVARRVPEQAARVEWRERMKNCSGA